ncbi:MAG: hypothetical protein RPT25_14105 [Cycloclasticus sp.]|jgi:hypothetical protein
MQSKEKNLVSISADHFKLCDYFFTNQTVKANPHYVNEEDDCSKSTLELKVELEIDPENSNIFLAQATVMSEKDIILKDRPDCSYEFYLAAFGRFEFVGIEEELNLRGKSLEYHAGLTCVQILIGAIRERLADLTSRGPWDKISIQTVGINRLHSQVEKALSSTEG